QRYSITTFSPSTMSEALTEYAHTLRHSVRRSGVEEPDHWHRLLLCTRRERPRRRAAEQRDELAPTAVDRHVALPWEIMPTQWSDDITLHALAVLRFMTSSYPALAGPPAKSDRP